MNESITPIAPVEPAAPAYNDRSTGLVVLGMSPRNLLLPAALSAFCLLLILTGCGTGKLRQANQVQTKNLPSAIHGSIVNERGTQNGWVVCQSNVITAIETDAGKLPPNAIRMAYDGYIFPGLIDTHNHAPWNTLPHWRAGHEFNSRYEWLTNSAYQTKVNFVFTNDIRKAITNSIENVAVKYAEVRAVIGGTTVIQSSFYDAEPRWLIRKLDANYRAGSYIPNIQTLLTNDNKLSDFTNGLASGSIHRVFLHIAEGRREDMVSSNEFAVLEADGLERSGVVVIHGIALGRAEFQKMATKQMYLVWSPESNLILYGETADVLEALADGVTVALAPDWTITGSDNVLAEMKVAWNYSQTNLNGRVTPRQLFKMVTVDAAKVAGLDGSLGRIAPKYEADFFLAPKLDKDPYLSLLATHPKDIQLVFVAGSPVYGALDRLKQLVPANDIDEIPVEGVNKGLVTPAGLSGAPGQHYQDIMRILTNALPNLAQLIETNK